MTNAKTSISTTTFVAAIFLLVVVALAAWWVVSRHEGIVIEFVVPDDARGVFIVRENLTKGSAPEIRGSLYSYTVPADGVVLTNDLSPFGKWHKMIARTKTGQRVRTSNTEGSSEEDIVLRELGGSSDNELFCVIGNSYDFNQAQSIFHDDLSKLKSLISNGLVKKSSEQ